MKARSFAWVLAAVLATPATAAAAAPASDQATASARPHGQRDNDGKRQTPSRKKWWLDQKARAELAINDEQSAKIDAVFESTMPLQRERWREFEKLEKELDALIKDGAVDATVIAQKVERVENLRAELNKTRTIMFYRMHSLLTPDQRVKFKAFHEREDADRRKSTDSQVRRY